MELAAEFDGIAWNLNQMRPKLAFFAGRRRGKGLKLQKHRKNEF